MLRAAAAVAAARRLPPGTLRLRHLPYASFSTSAPPPEEPPQSSPFQPPPPPPPPPPPKPQPQQQHGGTTAAPEQEPSYESASAKAAAAAENLRRKRRSRAKGGDYEDGQARVLKAALGHVRKLGWSESALIAGARDVGLSPSIVGSFPRKEAALVEFFMDDCLEKLIDTVESGELDLSNLILSERLSKLIRIRLEMQIPYISKWAQALSIQARPMNISTSFKQRAMLVDEIWCAAGDETSDVDWYIKRTILGGIYSTSEVYMLTDNSPEFRDTWTFLDRRIKDAFDIQKTAQEAAYIAEAVGTGAGNSMQAFMKRLFQGFKV